MKELDLSPRPVSDSQSEIAEIVLPNDGNPLGSLLGGRLMHWIDLAGATVGRNELVDREALPYRFDATERPEQRGQTSLCDAEDLDVDIF